MSGMLIFALNYYVYFDMKLTSIDDVWMLRSFILKSTIVTANQGRVKARLLDLKEW